MNLLQPRLCVKSRPRSAVELVATLDEPPAGVGEYRRLSDQVNWLRVRADLVGDLSPGWLRQEFGGRLLYALGGHGRAGGDDAGGQDRRRRLIAAAAEGYDLVELDAEKDLDGETLAAIPPEKRLIHWKGTVESASELASRFRRLAGIGRELISWSCMPVASRTGSCRCLSSDRRVAATSSPMRTGRWASGAGSSPPAWVPPGSSRAVPAAGGRRRRIRARIA